MSYKKIKLFCVTDKPLPNLENTNLILAGVGKNKFSSKYINTSTKINIFNKEEYGDGEYYWSVEDMGESSPNRYHYKDGKIYGEWSTPMEDEE